MRSSIVNAADNACLFSNSSEPLIRVPSDYATVSAAACVMSTSGKQLDNRRQQYAARLPTCLPAR